ncbi:Tropinesterase [Marinomonas aquimarina]|uniref:Tropinesterase n=1 Tax=Marinomonas aquimarina TaxID=295068 RepID=A0A1A8THA8_9GAMM|nr:alpha/beta hydrolase [Marinomonas aquimarina]SBS31439.1 Tropinesterase [Marinomonas aquimarina]
MSNETAFNLGHTKLAAKQWLSSDPDALPALMLHGWLDNAASFSHLAPYLPNYHLTALDLSGHGLSEHRPDGCFYHLWDYALDVISVLKAAPQPSWLIGHSMGGAVAMLVAALAPDKVRGLIVLDSMGPATATADQRVTTMQRAMQKMLKKRSGRFSRYPSQEDLIHARMHGFTELSYAAAKPLVERGSTVINGEWVWRADYKLSFPSPFRMDEASVEAFIQSIKCPTLALVANQGIFSQQQKLIEKRAKTFPWIKLKRLSGNHHFHLEPDTAAYIAEEIHRFIDQN